MEPDSEVLTFLMGLNYTQASFPSVLTGHCVFQPESIKHKIAQLRNSIRNLSRDRNVDSFSLLY